MLSQSTSSNLSEALINVKKIEQNFLNREFTFIDRERNKIRANVDRHMETFLQLTRKRHETWYRNDKHFREALRVEKENHEKRKERHRQKLLLASNPTYIPQVHTPFQPLTTENIVLPPITTPTITTEIPIANNTLIMKTKNNPSTITPRSEPMTIVDRRTHQVLRASQKLLDESAARSRYKFVPDRPSSVSFQHKRPPPPASSSSCSFNSGTLIVPMLTSVDCEEYNRLMHESLQHETFSGLVDHFVKFRPEFREQFGLIYEASKRQKAMEKLRKHNQIHAKTKDERYHKLVNSLTDLHSEQ
ncbi:unnamed protein product [Rotaria sordida]|uniref:Uncharacterized protein n=1 Tax=Rotaria sordida TaxID=392033 RepID=A0A814NJG1_9BILA|nr:unnamed protein product [Rotaria sordida]CAF1071724.1 unnamed protein product [Rotaria sordida]CAF1092352.1 unnamed protein product [Rotaria sordida]CAF3747481.1 unnamed protein product [Rotaria sordida]CAF3992490.1 unnamed protein product [Rotaria sordida]